MKKRMLPVQIPTGSGWLREGLREKRREMERRRRKPSQIAILENKKWEDDKKNAST